MLDSLHSQLDEIIVRNKANLRTAIEQRREEMLLNNIEHLELYSLLGIDADEGRRIDLYQNIGRFLYKYAGSMLEEATRILLNETKGGEPTWINNTVSANPKRFSIDSVVMSDKKAHEIKWRDATTDGDHITKERNKIQAIINADLIPVRVTYYSPNRSQARRIQERVMEEYRRHGEAYMGQEAWQYIRDYTGFNLFDYLYKRSREIGEENS